MTKRPATADEALTRLMAGNDRFVRGDARFPTVQKEILAQLARAQRPYATILGCSDSRVPPELLFDAGFGELFIVRVAGNVISPEVMGSLQYAGVHLRTPFLGDLRVASFEQLVVQEAEAARAHVFEHLMRDRFAQIGARRRDRGVDRLRQKLDLELSAEDGRRLHQRPRRRR